MILLTIAVSYVSATNGQSSSRLTLHDIIVLAKSQSIDYQLQINDFLASYWSYRTSKIKLLPTINLTSSPLKLNRRLIERYDQTQNIDIYKSTESLHSSSNLNISQIIPSTGAIVSINSSINRLDNFSGSKNVLYNVSPVSLSLSQPLFTFNNHKWERKLLPIQLDIAKKKLIQREQELYIKAAKLYFSMSTSLKMFSVAKYENSIADSLVQSGERLLKLNLITPNEYTELELKRIDAEIAVAEQKKKLDEARYELASFIQVEDYDSFEIEQDAQMPMIELNANEVLAYAKKSALIYTEIERLSLEKVLDQSKKQGGFSAKLNFSYGLNKSGNRLKETLNHPMDQQTGSVSFSIPLLNWGKHKGSVAMQMRKNSTSLLQIQKRITDFEKEIYRKTVQFQLQKTVYGNTKRALKLAKQTYAQKLNLFTMGRLKLADLNYAWMKILTSQQKHMQSISSYWILYFEIQRLTLHNLATQQELSVDFESIISTLKL